jgi:hypothetical protein
MKFKIVTLLAIAGLMALLPSIAYADNINLSSCPNGATPPCSGKTGKVESWTSGGLTITATGFKSAGKQDNLFIKTDGGDEHGLGLLGASDGEIQSGNFIQLDVSNLDKNGIGSGTLTFGSVQSGEGYEICVTNTAGTLKGATCFSGNADEKPVNVNWGKDKYIDITATKGDVLISDFSFTSTTPEPGTLGLTLLGAAGLLAFAIRRTAFGG